MSNKIPNLTLSNGTKIPALGFGTFEDVPEGMYNAVLCALDTGYRHLDCAWYYKNETEVGAALRTWLTQNPSVPRSEIFITTKIWPHLMTPEDLRWSLDSSLQKLGVEYVDALLLHWPVAAERDENYEVAKDPVNNGYILKPDQPAALLAAWETMISLLTTTTKVKAIGVSNFSTTHLKPLLHTSHPPMINQIEIHPYFPNTHLISFCAQHKIQAVAYSPLGSQGQTVRQGQTVATVLTDPTLQALAAEKGCSIAQLCIAWGIQRGYAVLPKSANEGRLRANFEVVSLSEGEMERINGIAGGIGRKDGKGVRMVNPIEMFGFDLWEGEDE
ncbi:NAD(P)-linked oxidoreductase [Glarea lozoyensis ATCC 20868]|uniref:NAD(P)-linked oxidoreductase n=1 Tax=Glarea lozoyensis (strain ATCC 20868 / MF5171) TaxID=1116229 RepID=S3DBX5_GLAL2|nr:NAD(P)-linked oxidoreductase [Glarea lozoyensis ATCC 20868]EPE34604.1 NAD(P)-linked oxidoreductase [Glarea lozoyensis ATCC 20868]